MPSGRSPDPDVALTDSLTRAFDLARSAHAGQTRRGTAIPYLSHLLAVAALVLEFGGDERAAIVALLHDVVEDCGGAARLAEIRAEFGDEVASMVSALSDTDQDPKPPWKPRKVAAIARLKQDSPTIQLVAFCDKLHNARSIVADLAMFGAATWSKFNGGRDGTLWYYQSLVEVAAGSCLPPRLVAEFAATVTEMHRLSGE
jgi:(p)ppGpp synthase/HD superfamily hydrolase